MKLELKVSDFLPDGCSIGHRNDCPTIAFVEKANARLAEMLKDAPIAYGNKSSKYGWSLNQEGSETHRALLVNIEKINE